MHATLPNARMPEMRTCCDETPLPRWSAMNGGYRPSQTEQLAAALRDKRAQGKPLELPQIMHDLGIAQHGARFKELRDRGFKIINELESVDGRLHSRYWLLFDPERDKQ